MLRVIPVLEFVCGNILEAEHCEQQSFAMSVSSVRVTWRVVMVVHHLLSRPVTGR